jgi:uncharacterized membrane protein YciS (DUF1049 family)
MMACPQPGSRSKHARLARKAHALMTRYRASCALAVNFAGGVVIGAIIVLFVWLMLG